MLVPREAAVVAAVLEVHLADDERTPVSLEEQLKVERLLHRPVVVEPDHLQRHRGARAGESRTFICLSNSEKRCSSRSKSSKKSAIEAQAHLWFWLTDYDAVEARLLPFGHVLVLQRLREARRDGRRPRRHRRRRRRRRRRRDGLRVTATRVQPGDRQLTRRARLAADVARHDDVGADVFRVHLAYRQRGVRRLDHHLGERRTDEVTCSPLLTG